MDFRFKDIEPAVEILVLLNPFTMKNLLVDSFNYSQILYF
jgi:hypothetical protein